jgi:hypothetical protein
MESYEPLVILVMDDHPRSVICGECNAAIVFTSEAAARSYIDVHWPGFGVHTEVLTDATFDSSNEDAVQRQMLVYEREEQFNVRASGDALQLQGSEKPKTYPFERSYAAALATELKRTAGHRKFGSN